MTSIYWYALWLDLELAEQAVEHTNKHGALPPATLHSTPDETSQQREPHSPSVSSEVQPVAPKPPSTSTVASPTAHEVVTGPAAQQLDSLVYLTYICAQSMYYMPVPLINTYLHLIETWCLGSYSHSCQLKHALKIKSRKFFWLL